MEKKNNYPIMPVSNWWAIRNRFKQSIPTTVSAGYLSTLLNMEEKSAQVNVMPYLLDFGIIDAEGKPTERANKWRDDEEYPNVCKEILKEVYPQDLLEALPEQELDRSKIRRWFSKNTGLGERAVNKMAAVFELLVKADPLDSQNTSQKNNPLSSSSKVTKARKIKNPTVETNLLGKDSATSKKIQIQPSIHLDIQIHISPDASSDQIDQIFLSMAKHLFRDQ